jgi:hypothetical protein
MFLIEQPSAASEQAPRIPPSGDRQSRKVEATGVG